MLVAVPSCERMPLPLRVELPAPGTLRSSTTTLRPRRARKHAQESPMTPAPTMATSLLADRVTTREIRAAHRRVRSVNAVKRHSRTLAQHEDPSPGPSRESVSGQ